MFIAFEGPDNTGKSTLAASLATDQVAVYNVTKESHQVYQQMINPEPDLVVTYDRIDWLTHMVYRLALPDREWNDPRVRTVFAMPDTHLVVLLHKPEHADFTADEVVDTPIGRVNPMYYYFGDFLMNLNRVRNYELFKSITLVEIEHEGGYRLRVADHDSAPFQTGVAMSHGVDTGDRLLGFLRYVDQHIG